PRFDLVTGVSTGALMATFAFLGDDADDEVLRAVYTSVRNGDVFDGPINGERPNAVFGTSPLRRLIAKHVTPEVVRRVADAHRAGRRLYVATVELDAGDTVVWPLSRMAADAAPACTVAVDPAGVERFRAVLLAAAAIPVLFPPVEIDGGLHVDAGLREGLFLRPAMLGPADAGAASTGDTPAVYAVVNGTLRSDPENVTDHVLHIGVRSLRLFADALLLFNLRDAAHAADARRFAFRWTSEPEGLDGEEGLAASVSGATFDPAVMAKLYAAGRAAGEAGVWQQGAPGVGADGR
ncbi:MAG TPA: patatin-like phospholipase family protein, partial [Humisphaera sp.]